MCAFNLASDLAFSLHSTGEKKRLKKERMEAKRAARAAARGFDLAWVNRQLEEFVARQGDMQVRCVRCLRCLFALRGWLNCQLGS